MDVSLVPMRPRGHPSRLYSDLAMMQHYRGVAGSSAAVDINNTVSSSCTATMQSPESSSQCDAPETADGNGTAIMSQHDALADNDASDGDDAAEDEDEAVLHWSVEMAAVNQAILSLTGQQPITAVSVAAAIGRRDAAAAESAIADVSDDVSGNDRSSLNTPPPSTTAWS